MICSAPMLTCVLRPGDWLYVPTGWWHAAQGLEGDSITLAIGLMTPSALQFLDFLRRELAGQVVWRQRLPGGGAAAGWSDEERLAFHRSMLKDLASDLARLLRDETLLERFVLSLRSDPGTGVQGRP